jgi:hypothetical protein
LHFGIFQESGHNKMAKHDSKTVLNLMRAGTWTTMLALAGFFGGCDSGGSGSMSAPSTTEAKISGNVSDETGPVTRGRLEVTDKNGRVVASTELQDSNHYDVAIPAGTAYPIVITVFPPADAVSTAPVKAVVTSEIADRQDITAVSTIVVDSALALGGLTPENIAKASGGAIGLRQTSGASAAVGGAGAGPGQSGGGVGRGGHAGHGRTSSGDQGTASPSSSNPPPMQH